MFCYLWICVPLYMLLWRPCSPSCTRGNLQTFFCYFKQSATVVILRSHQTKLQELRCKIWKLLQYMQSIFWTSFPLLWIKKTKKTHKKQLAIYGDRDSILLLIKKSLQHFITVIQKTVKIHYYIKLTLLIKCPNKVINICTSHIEFLDDLFTDTENFLKHTLRK